MKSTNKIDGDAFARGLAQQASAPRDNHVIIAQETISLKDEATQSAQAYWMMGWTWDEIESVLEDSEYPSNVITHAIKETKEYAAKILNEGPFAVLKMGQEVKLINGSIGVLVEKYPEHVTIDLKGIGNVNIAEDQLDIVATEQLRDAHFLRMKAVNMLYKLSTDQLEPISVESQMVDPVLESVDNALSTMASIQQNSDEVKREAAKIHGKWEADIGKWEPKSAEEHDFAQYLQVTLAGENELDREITDVFHAKLGSILASLHDEIRKGAVVTDESIMNFLGDTFVNITTNLEAHLFGIKQHNVKAREYVQQFAKLGKEEGEWKTDAVQFAMSSWERTKEFINTWEDKLVPGIENGIQAISSFLESVNKQQITASIQRALNTL